MNSLNRIGLVDMFAWNPHCRNLDGIGSAGTFIVQNVLETELQLSTD